MGGEEVPEAPPTSQKVMVQIFGVIIALKTLFFDYHIFFYVKRYLQTYKTWMQAEIWIFIITAIKVSILAPNYWIKDMNWIYWTFILNSLTTFWLSHVLHQRNGVVLARGVRVSWAYTALTIFRTCTLFFFIFVYPAIFENWHPGYEFLMRCSHENHVYPLDFLFIYIIDFLSAVTDLVVFIHQPRTAGQNELLRETRVADIEAGVGKRRATVQDKN